MASTAHMLLDDSASRLNLIKRLMEAEIDALAGILGEETAHFPAVFDDAVKGDLKGGKENPLPSEAMKSWIEEKATLADKRRIEDCEAAVALFIEIAGDKPVADYSEGDVREFKEILRKLPANRNKKRETARPQCTAGHKKGAAPRA